MPLSKLEGEFLISQKVARMATITGRGIAHLVPICYAFDSQDIYFATDLESKKIRNIALNKKVSIIIDEYFEDWSRLKGLLIYGEAEILKSDEDYNLGRDLLYKKYPQYKDFPIEEGKTALIRVKPIKIISWGLS
ncbi:MAG: pyridoxamine 5'-phosphate oxidase family protein [archaeon]|nr:pyridoxamine 5'-phosphate oxidase family protein [archaeon]MCP8314495.1 pyridoxamine 5'-phosphate oxidase family protein [archaeon]MCP8315812.1 pyridoxamine 5'-phosphate oxidase family protein [archaeon]MCP8321768.1 pyridoxamine 5'-phosphate oxidase family protein [archaeon]